MPPPPPPPPQRQKQQRPRRTRRQNWTRKKAGGGGGSGSSGGKKSATSQEETLHKIYYNYGEEGALNNNIQTLLRLLKNAGFPKATSAHVLEFLSKQPGYTVHKRLKKAQFKRRPILVSTSKVRADADLIELGDLASWNDGFRYIFIIIDAFSRYVWCRPIKSKEASSTANALKEIVEKEQFQTISLYTDGGKEFSGAPFQSVLKATNMKHRICTSDDYHCPFVERVIRTIKEKLFQAMTTNHTRRWVELLPLIIRTYNETIHSATNHSPQRARLPENYLYVLQKLMKTRKKRYITEKVKQYKFKVGDHVRILLSKGGPLGKKGYLPKFSWEIFKVKKLANDRPLDGGNRAIPAYVLEDLQGELIENALFYEQELSRVHKEQLHKAAPVREILEEKGDRVKVWFQGFPKSSAEWVLRKNLV